MRPTLAHLRLFLLECSSLRRHRMPVLPEGRVPGGSLRHRDGVPLLELEGSPAEMGRAHGLLLREPIRRLKNAYFDAFFRSYAAKCDRSAFEAVCARLGEYLPDRHREELHGLAEGAGLEWREALFLQTFLDVHKLAFCSTFAATTPGGRLVLGRNLDFPSMGLAHRYGLVAIQRGKGVRPVASVGWPGILGTLSGINDAGLALAMMVVYLVEDAEEGCPYAIQYRRILEEESDVDGAVRRLAAEPHTNSNNVLLGDAGGRAARVEIRPSGIERFDRTSGALCATNHFRGAGRRPFTLHPQYLSSYLRLHRLERDARALGGAPRIPDAIRMLRGTAPPLGNLQSMVLLPRERTILLAMGTVPAARGRFVPFTLAWTSGSPR